MIVKTVPVGQFSFQWQASKSFFFSQLNSTREYSRLDKRKPQELHWFHFCFFQKMTFDTSAVKGMSACFGSKTFLRLYPNQMTFSFVVFFAFVIIAKNQLSKTKPTVLHKNLTYSLKFNDSMWRKFFSIFMYFWEFKSKKTVHAFINCYRYSFLSTNNSKKWKQPYVLEH